VKLPGDPEMPERAGVREPEGFGGEGFRDRELADDVEIPPEAE